MWRSGRRSPRGARSANRSPRSSASTWLAGERTRARAAPSSIASGSPSRPATELPDRGKVIVRRHEARVRDGRPREVQRDGGGSADVVGGGVWRRCRQWPQPDRVLLAMTGRSLGGGEDARRGRVSDEVQERVQRAVGGVDVVGEEQDWRRPQPALERVLEEGARRDPDAEGRRHPVGHRADVGHGAVDERGATGERHRDGGRPRTTAGSSRRHSARRSSPACRRGATAGAPRHGAAPRVPRRRCGSPGCARATMPRGQGAGKVRQGAQGRASVRGDGECAPCYGQSVCPWVQFRRHPGGRMRGGTARRL